MLLRAEWKFGGAAISGVKEVETIVNQSASRFPIFEGLAMENYAGFTGICAR